MSKEIETNINIVAVTPVKKNDIQRLTLGEFSVRFTVTVPQMDFIFDEESPRGVIDETADSVARQVRARLIREIDGRANFEDLNE